MFCDLSRRKASVDENYEWDAADIYSQPGDRDGEDFDFILVQTLVKKMARNH